MSLIRSCVAANIHLAVRARLLPALEARPGLSRHCGRHYSTPTRSPATDPATLNETRAVVAEWAKAISNYHAWTEEDVSLERLRELWATLPTREESFRDVDRRCKTVVPYGHHLVYFSPRSREEDLRPDGSDTQLAPPVPEWRRMWAGGEMRWPARLEDGLHAGSGSPVGMSTVITDVQLKGFEEGGRPMVFVAQELSWRSTQPKLSHNNLLWEKRMHVYIPPASEKRGVKPG